MRSNNQYRPGMKRKRKGGGQDFRWKKVKMERKMETMSGDALEDEVPINEPSHTAKGGKKETARGIKLRQLEAKRRRREKHEQEREEADALIRSAPYEYLWSCYTDWASEKVASADLGDPWGSEHVTVLEDSGEPLISHVKAILGDDYATRGGFNGGGVPGVALIALAASALNAVGFAKRLYDGFPVGKLFSKHVKIEEQKEWLERSCRKRLPPTAAGTAKRVQRLVEEGDMTLAHTAGLVIDMSRDMRLMNIVDIASMRNELFEFLHQHVRPLIEKGKIKVILCIPKVQATKLEDVKEELMTRMNNAKKRRKQSRPKQKPVSEDE